MGIAILNGVDILHAEKSNVFSYPSHAHTYYEMILYQPFDGYITVNGVKIEVTGSVAVIMTPYDIHSISVAEESKKGEFVKIQFDRELIKNITDLPEQAFVLKNPSEFFIKMAYEIYEHQNMLQYSKMLICASVDMIIKSGERLIADKKGRMHTVVVGAIKIINNRFDEDISLVSVSKELGITSQHLSKIFKQETGRNFNEYLCKVRLDYGAELLKSGKYDVTQVCYNCGYKNLSHFTRSFKKQYGVTPGTVNKARHLK